MKLGQFLSRVCPDAGFYYTATQYLPPGKTKPVFAHKAFDDIPAFTRGIKSHTTKSPDKDIWFAVASFRDKTRPSDFDGKARPSRKQDNVAALKAFFIDIDCKGEQGQYIDKREALVAFRALVDAGEVQKPSIVVDSGNGLHIYWTLDVAVDPTEWKPIAVGLQDRLASLGLKIDGGITIDSARLLRPINTSNCKDPLNPKSVFTLLDTGPDYPVSDFLHFRAFTSSHVKMKPKAAASTLPPITASEAEKMRELFGDYDDQADAIPLMGRPAGTFEMAHIIDRCQQMRNLLADQGASAPEPLWKATLLLSAACRDGETWAHALSEGHASYTHRETQAKFEEQRDKLDKGVAGATRCDHFARLNPTGCAGCPWLTQIKSPISLGREIASSSKMPAQFTSDGRDTFIVLPSEDEDGQVEHKRVCAGLFDVARLIRDETATTGMGLFMRLTYRLKQGNGGQVRKEVTVDVEMLRGKGAQETLAASGITFQPGEIKGLRHLMTSWAEELETSGESTETLALKSGWSEDQKSFIVGEVEITATGTRSIARASGAVYSGQEAKGDLDRWKAVAKAFMSTGTPVHQTGFAVAFAAPLAKLVGLPGFVVSLHSDRTGTGKTTTLNMGLSVWGLPVKLTHNFNDTANAVLNKIGTNPNLPAFWDEMRAAEPRSQMEFFTTVFSLAQGREKARSDRSGKARDTNEWHTMMCVGTNFSLREQLDAEKSDKTPEKARLLELDVPAFPEGVTTRHLTTFNTLSSHYGLACVPYMQAVLTVMDKLPAMLDAVAQRFYAALPGGMEAEARMWAKAVSCIVVGAALARKAGLVDFDPEAILKACLDAAARQLVVRDMDDDPAQAFRDWLMSNTRSWVITEMGHPTGARARGSDEKLLVFVDLDRDKLHVQTGTLRLISEIIGGKGKHLLLKKHFDKKFVPIVQNPAVGRGTQNARSTGRYYVFDLRALDLREAAENLISSILPVRMI